MRSLLNPDAPVMRFITKIADSFLLNLLWFMFSLPIVTAGAAATALFDISLKIVNDEDGAILGGFINSFRSNFRTSTKTWLILLAAEVVFAIDGYVLYHIHFANAFWTIMTALYLVALAAYLIVLMYVFPLMACFENTSAAMIKNAFMVGMRFLVCTALQACVYFLMLLIAVRFFTPILLLGEGLCALICSWLMNGIIKQLREKAQSRES